MKIFKYNRIKAVIAEKDVSNKDLADHLNTTAAVVSNWVTNKNQPSIQTFHLIADFLDVSIYQLLLEHPEEVGTKPKPKRKAK